MPDLERESHFVERLITAIPELSAATLIRREAPDFVLLLGHHRIGVELTEFHLAPEVGTKPYAETTALRRHIVRSAQAAHTLNGGPPLYVTCAFHDREVIARRDTKELSQQIARAVLSTTQNHEIAAGAVTVPYNLLPRAVAKIWCWASVDGKDLLWNPMVAGWVADIPPGQVAAVINKKNRKVSTYRAGCDEVWLTIFHSPAGAPADLSTTAARELYQSRFDRVVWLDPLVPRALDLATRAA
jgi:hypothetical protein